MKTQKRITLADLVPEPHPLKAKIKDAGLTLWQLSYLIGGKPCEAHLSRILNGHMPMSIKIEQAIVDGLGRLDVELES